MRDNPLVKPDPFDDTHLKSPQPMVTTSSCLKYLFESKFRLNF